MKTINICGEHPYNPLIVVVKAICEAKTGEQLEVILDDIDVFNDLKKFLAEQHVGFREIYDGEQMRLQFIKEE